jgi:hypothetical protein
MLILEGNFCHVSYFDFLYMFEPSSGTTLAFFASCLRNPSLLPKLVGQG